MKNLLLLFGSVLALGLTAYAQQVNKTVEWDTFESPAGRFKAAFPRSPERSVSEQDGPQGKYTVVEYSIILPYAAFMITYADFSKSAPTNQDQLRAYYDRFRMKMIERSGARLVGERDVIASEHLGREVEMIVDDQNVSYRVYNVGRRLYQTITSYSTAIPSEFAIKKEVTRFLDSFQLIEKN